MDRELGDVDGGLVELAQDAAQGGDVAVGGDLQGEGIAVAYRDVERSGAGELGCGVGERQVDAAAGDTPLELLRGPLGDEASAVEDRDAVGEPVGLVEVLGGQEDGGAVADEAADDVPHGAAAAGIEAGGRLVEEDDLRRADQRHRQVEPAAHPAGVRHGYTVGGVDQLEALEQLVDPLPRRARGGGAGRPSARGSRDR